MRTAAHSGRSDGSQLINVGISYWFSEKDLFHYLRREYLVLDQCGILVIGVIDSESGSGTANKLKVQQGPHARTSTTGAPVKIKHAAKVAPSEDPNISQGERILALLNDGAINGSKMRKRTLWHIMNLDHNSNSNQYFSANLKYENLKQIGQVNLYFYSARILGEGEGIGKNFNQCFWRKKDTDDLPLAENEQLRLRVSGSDFNIFEKKGACGTSFCRGRKLQSQAVEGVITLEVHSNESTLDSLTPLSPAIRVKPLGNGKFLERNGDFTTDKQIIESCYENRMQALGRSLSDGANGKNNSDHASKNFFIKGVAPTDSVAEVTGNNNTNIVSSDIKLQNEASESKDQAFEGRHESASPENQINETLLPDPGQSQQSGDSQYDDTVDNPMANRTIPGPVLVESESGNNVNKIKHGPDPDLLCNCSLTKDSEELQLSGPGSQNDNIKVVQKQVNNNSESEAPTRISAQGIPYNGQNTTDLSRQKSNIMNLKPSKPRTATITFVCACMHTGQLVGSSNSVTTVKRITASEGQQQQSRLSQQSGPNGGGRNSTGPQGNESGTLQTISRAQQYEYPPRRILEKSMLEYVERGILQIFSDSELKLQRFHSAQQFVYFSDCVFLFGDLGFSRQECRARFTSDATEEGTLDGTNGSSSQGLSTSEEMFLKCFHYCEPENNLNLNNDDSNLNQGAIKPRGCEKWEDPVIVHRQGSNVRCMTYKQDLHYCAGIFEILM